MKKHTILLTLLTLSTTLLAGIPDSVFIRHVALPRGGGLLLEWSADGRLWSSATQGRILGSDFGTWGPEKKLYSPSLAVVPDGLIAVVFQLNDRVNQFAVTTTRDFIHWRPQDYPYMEGVGQCLDPVIRFTGNDYVITFHNKDGRYFQTSTRDLIHFTAPISTSMPANVSMISV